MGSVQSFCFERASSRSLFTDSPSVIERISAGTEWSAGQRNTQARQGGSSGSAGEANGTINEVTCDG